MCTLTTHRSPNARNWPGLPSPRPTSYRGPNLGERRRASLATRAGARIQSEIRRVRRSSRVGVSRFRDLEDRFRSVVATLRVPPRNLVSPTIRGNYARGGTVCEGVYDETSRAAPSTRFDKWRLPPFYPGSLPGKTRPVTVVHIPRRVEGVASRVRKSSVRKSASRATYPFV